MRTLGRAFPLPNFRRSFIKQSPGSAKAKCPTMTSFRDERRNARIAGNLAHANEFKPFDGLALTQPDLTELMGACPQSSLDHLATLSFCAVHWRT